MSQKRSIVEVVYSLGLGGSEILGKDLAVAFTKEFRYRCAVCAIEKGGVLGDELAAEGIKTFVARGPGTGVAAGVVNLTRFLRMFRPDVVHTHHLNQLFYGIIGAKLAGARIIHTEHEYFSLQVPKHQWMLRFLSRYCDCITTVGEQVTSYLSSEVKIPSNKLVTIPNGINLSLYSREYSLRRDALGIKGDETIIGIVARLEPVKGHVILFAAFSQVLKRYPNCRLLVIGKGSLEEILATEVKRFGIDEKVTFVGPRRDIPALLPLMDVLVLSSLEEGLPMSLLEGMAAGLPVVASGVGSIPEVISSGVNGLLVPPGDLLQLSASLERLIEDSLFRTRLGAAAQATISSRFNFAHTLAAYNKIFLQ